ncbi:hypothetical protein J8273_3615 [Carpediemonas membranifera]|uniref:Uncharacterized protein n=1 Tax=Carpediemonas membranifera TaxID=201153 RepID=A0A8J6E9K5_9EUKA|nr:hypothetical protein J8273_3615 [Carpediemonas membranifera]|eukprot:KAG9393475.1 hypothetical protein J8273_3615 [Carpediemonas membranifera]
MDFSPDDLETASFNSDSSVLPADNKSDWIDVLLTAAAQFPNEFPVAQALKQAPLPRKRATRRSHTMKKESPARQRRSCTQRALQRRKKASDQFLAVATKDENGRSRVEVLECAWFDGTGYPIAAGALAHDPFTPNFTGPLRRWKMAQHIFTMCRARQTLY